MFFQVQRLAILHDISGVPRAACAPFEEENSVDDLILRCWLWGQTKANYDSDSESEGDDGDSLETNLSARDGDVAKVTADVPIDGMRSRGVAPYVKDRVTFAPLLL